MVLVKSARQPLCQFARFVVIDTDQSTDIFALGAGFLRYCVSTATLVEPCRPPPASLKRR